MKDFPKIKHVVPWGKERQDSVRNWIEKVTGRITLIHNWANPLVGKEEIDAIILAAEEHGTAVVGQKAINTLKQVDENWFVIRTVPRHDIYEVQTPQAVTTEVFRKAMEKWSHETLTDDVSFLERENLPVKIVPSSSRNFKITVQDDLDKAESLINKKQLIGIGHDSHKFTDQQKTLHLGGIEIACWFWSEGNSNWDALIHAMCNALWTAIGEWSLSLYADKMCKGEGIKDSREYLKHIFKKVQERGYEIGNIACTIEAAKPKLEVHIPKMKEVLSDILGCSSFQIGIACTTWEWLTDFGKWLWLQCFVNLILIKKL